MKVRIGAILIVVAAVCFLGCHEGSTKVTLPGAAGALLGFDASGHATSNLKYSQGYNVYAFNTDGSFEIDYYGGETTTTTSYQTGGDMGSYVYDPSTFKLTKTFTKYYDSSLATPAWVDSNATASESQVSVEPWYFAEHAIGQVYTPDSTADPSSWTCTNVRTYADASTGFQSTTTNINTYGQNASSGIFTYTRVGTKVTTDNTSGFVVRDDKIMGSYSSLPSGKALAADAIVTFWILPTVNYTNVYTSNSTGTTGNTLTSNKLGYVNYTFYNDGQFIYFLPGSRTRVLR